MPALRITERQARSSAPQDEPSLPGEGLPQALLRAHQQRHGQFKARLSDLGYRDLPAHDLVEGVSSMKLHRDLGITQKSAWHLAHRLRKSWEHGNRSVRPPMRGSVEVDESYFGGLLMKDRDSNEIRAEVTPDTKQKTLQKFVHANAPGTAKVYTDECKPYEDLENRESVKHSTCEYVKGMSHITHIDGMESLRAMLKRGYRGVYHHMSPEHLNRYVSEFAGRHSIRELDTNEQMASVVRGMLFKRLRYSELIAH